MIKCGITGATGVLGKIITKEIDFKFIYFREKIENKKKVSQWVKNNNFDIIIHLAAIVPVSKVNSNFDKALKVNFYGTKNLVDAIIKYKSNLKWFFFSSTSHVYKLTKKFIRISERFKRDSQSKYGFTKIKAENYIINQLKKTKIKFCIGRIFSFTDQNQNTSFLIPNLIKIIKNAKSDNIFLKDLNHYRDFVSTKSIAKAVYFLSKKKSQGIYNIGSGQAIFLKNVAKFISIKFKKECNFEENEKTFLIANISKLNKLGFKYSHNFYRDLDILLKK